MMLAIAAAGELPSAQNQKDVTVYFSSDQLHLFALRGAVAVSPQ